MLLRLLSSPPPTQTSDFFSSSVWQFLSGAGAIIAIPIAIIATITAILAYRQQKRRKELTYLVVSDAPIASINKTLENRVEILLDGKPVKDTRLLVLRLWNSGNVSIKVEDYFDPLIFEFEKRNVLGSDVIETKPNDLLDQKNIKSFLKIEAESIEIAKYPLNPNDSVTFTVLIDGKGKVTKKGRINEGKIKEFEYSKPQMSTRSATIAGIGAIIVVSTEYLSIATNNVYFIALFLILTFIYGIFLLQQFLLVRRRRKLLRNIPPN